jgi:hypothetical protein
MQEIDSHIIIHEAITETMEDTFGAVISGRIKSQGLMYLLDLANEGIAHAVIKVPERSYTTLILPDDVIA